MRAGQGRLWVVVVVGAALLGVTLPQTIEAAIACAPVNADAGYYLGVARALARGASLYADVPSGYPPLAMELWALGPSEPLAHLLWARLSIWGAHLGAAALLFAIVARETKSRATAAVAVLAYVAVLGPLEGWAIALEPFSVLFGMGAVWLILRWPAARWIPLGAGALLGCAVLTKQYALLWLPGLLGFFPARGPVKRRTLVEFGVGVAAPFLVYCLLRGHSPFALGWHLATFGGVHYPSAGANGLGDVLLRKPAGLVLASMMVALVVGLALCPRRCWPWVALAVGGALPLWIRAYPHYGLNWLPWHVVLVAILASEFTAGARQTAAAAALGLLPMCAALPGYWHVQQRLCVDGRLSDQIAAAAQVRATLGADAQVVPLGGVWLWALLDAPAPRRDFAFGGGQLARHWDDADAVLLFPIRNPERAVWRLALEAEGLAPQRTGRIEFTGRKVVVFRERRAPVKPATQPRPARVPRQP